MARLVDDLRLEQWRQLDSLYVLDRLGCYAKRDVSFHPIKASKTARYHVNANGRDWELLITGPKFWDTRADKGGGGAVDLVMHLFNVDFKCALRTLRTALPVAPSISPRSRPQDDDSPLMAGHKLAGPNDGAA